MKMKIDKIIAKLHAKNNSGSLVGCRYCQNELAPRIDYKEAETATLKQQIQNFEREIKSLRQELVEKDSKL